jgi:hypothetical protein
MPNEKKTSCLKIQIMIDTKMIVTTKKNTPFGIISQIEWWYLTSHDYCRLKLRDRLEEQAIEYTCVFFNFVLFLLLSKWVFSTSAVSGQL